MIIDTNPACDALALDDECAVAVEHQLVGLWRDGSPLRAYTYTHFTDKSGRADYGTHDIFQPAN